MGQNKNPFDEGGLGFDPVAFARGIYSSIEQYRSQFGSIPNEVIVSPSQHGIGGSQGESRINTFYRLLGFPATRNESLIKTNKDLQEDDKRFELVSADGTFNYVSNISLSDGDTNNLLIKRSEILSRPIDTVQFNKLLSNPIGFAESIDGKSSRRAQIFPLTVDASIPVFPLERRVAPLFYGKDYLMSGGETRLSRPFIEHIIYIRSKVFSGFKDEKLSAALKKNIEDALPSDLSVDNILKNITPSVIEAYIIEKFIQTLGQLVDDFSIAKKAANKIIKEINYMPGFVNNPEQRSGNSTDNTSSDGFSTDEKIRDIERVLREKESYLFLLPTEFITRSDTVRRKDEELDIHNVRSDIFVSNFAELITYEADELRKELEIAKSERQRKISQMEVLKRDLMYFTGEFTGLSIFDIISIFYALFTVDLKYLVGLLNADAQDRFISDPFFSRADKSTDGTQTFKSIADILPGGQTTVASVSDSIEAVQDKVREAFSIAEAFEAQKTGVR